MLTQIKTALLLTVAAVAMTTSAQAQFAGNVTQDLQRLRQQFNANAHPQNKIQRPMNQRHGSSLQHLPVRRNANHVHPQYPVHVSADRFDGYNPYTGGIDTTNEQINNTYYDRHREASKYNGTRRWVRRPVYDASGRVSGYQEGYVWNNSVTGVEHAELQNVTANNKGGTHRQISVSSARP